MLTCVRFLCATVLSVLTIAILPARAQDPFGGGGDPFGGTSGTDPFSGNQADPFGGSSATTTDPGAGFGNFGQANSPMAAGNAANVDVPDEPEESDPVVRLLRAETPSTPTDMAEGITWMVRLKRWDEVGRLLDEVAKANWSLDQKAALARAAGSAIWLRLRSGEAELSEAQQALASEILNAPGNVSRSPEWIKRWVEQLGDSHAAKRRLAQLRLQDGGVHSVVDLTGRLLDGDTTVAPVMLSGTLLEFGRDGVAALQTAALVKDRERAGRVVKTLAHTPGKHFNAEIGASLYDTSFDESFREELASILLEKFGNVPSQEAVAQYLQSRFETALAEYQLARSATTVLDDLVCKLTANREDVEFVQAASTSVPLERLSQIATWRMQQPNPSQETLAICLAAKMQRAYQWAPQLSLGELGTTLLSEMPESVITGETWKAAFKKSNEYQLHGGSLRALQMLAQTDAGNPETLSFLSDLLYDSRAMVRFSALSALNQIDPRSGYRGSDKAVEVALEMSHLSRGPHTLVVGLHAELRQVAQQQIQLQTDSGVTAVNSGQAAIVALNGQEPIELVIVVDRVTDLSIFELLQRVRNTAKGQALPIAVLTDELYQHERNFVERSPGMFASVLSRDPLQMRRVINQLQDMLDTEPLSQGDRVQFAATGGQFLSRIITHRERYPFYSLGPWHQQLVSTAATLPLADEAHLLAGVGTPTSQWKLVELTAQGAGTEDRMAAANGFLQSVQRYGMKLSRNEVLATYKLYNEQGPSDPISAKTLGHILDVIEAQAGKADWPEGL